ncbi:helix-turn-helix domain-containing protein [Clostridium perfringens]|uniref:helix-turn-helix domain-containing protein n=1 Tax=Clostridium perfringens TaxID=1502 RepID=UPI0022458782|nr:helix-turn-helix domain-containing protein [Clostridium perfringens]MCX0403252.1 helix-turn-helix domain-containing protein [Clostridium perfringens]
MDEIRYEGKSILSKGYGIIPKLIMQSDISIEAKAIYAYMCSFAGNGQSAFPSIKKIRSELRISEDRFYKYRKELINNGFIQVKQNKFKGKIMNNTYIIPQVVNFLESEKPYPQNKGTDKKPYPKNPCMENPCKENPCKENEGTNNNKTNNNKTNNNNVNNNNREVVVDKEVKKILKGFTSKEISSVIKFCEENKVHVGVVEEKLKVLKSMKKVNNKVGALISAIKNDWKESSGIDNNKNPKEANFTQREYDYDDLEKKLLGWDE